MPRLQPTHRGHPGSPARIHVRAALALFLAAVVSGCATTGSNYPYFERIAIEVLPPTPVKEDEAVASAGELAAAGAAAISQEELFGQSSGEVQRTVEEATGSERIDSMNAQVTRLQQYDFEKVVISLDNEQVWKQVDSSSLRLRVGDDVIIERAAFGSFMLKKVGSKRTMRVSRMD